MISQEECNDQDRRALEAFGEWEILFKAVEEFGELLQAVSKETMVDRRKQPEVNNGDMIKIADEIADCCIMLNQLSIYYDSKLPNFMDFVEERFEFKRKRLERRIQNGSML